MLWDTIFLALREIRRNVMRSFLTILGIVIGVASVITMVTLGSGATVQVTQQIASLGSNLLMVTPGQRMGPGQAVAAPFRLKDAEAIAREVPSVAAVAPASSQAVTAILSNENWTTTATGTNNQYLQVRSWSLKEGRLFSDSELRAGASAS
jgi:putative ABC transport system permease protein